MNYLSFVLWIKRKEKKTLRRFKNMSFNLFKNLFKNSKRNQIKKLFSQVEELKEENENLAHELTMLKSAQEGNEYTPENIEEINERLDDLEQHNIEELADDVDSLKSQIDDIDYDNLSYDLQRKIDDIDDIRYVIDRHDFDDLEGRLDDLEEAHQDTKDKVEDVCERVATLETQGAPSSEDLNAKIEELKQVKQDLKNIFVKVAEIFND